jgi:uncharacterized membrane protein YkvA (DUF1232 family)
MKDQHSALNRARRLIFGAGYIDDATVIGCVVAQANEELANFKRWRAASDSPEDLPAPSS